MFVCGGAKAERRALCKVGKDANPELCPQAQRIYKVSLCSLEHLGAAKFQH